MTSPMMMSLSVNSSGELVAGQRAVPPVVYLDHWALRLFSEDPAWRTRLTAALVSRDGTLTLSWANLAEFATVGDQRQARDAEALIESLLPRIFLLEVNPFIVIGREDQLLAGGPPLAPHGDAEILRALVMLKPRTPTVLTAHDLFTVIRGEEAAERTERIADVFLNQIAQMRDEAATDRALQATLRRHAMTTPIQRGTRFILRELVRAILLDGARQTVRNDAFDFFHAVVPVAYCDFVLVDGYWEVQLNRVRSRLEESGFPVPMARVFSRRRDGLDRFIRELEQA